MGEFESLLIFVFFEYLRVSLLWSDMRGKQGFAQRLPETQATSFNLCIHPVLTCQGKALASRASCPSVRLWDSGFSSFIH